MRLGAYRSSKLRIAAGGGAVVQSIIDAVVTRSAADKGVDCRGIIAFQGNAPWNRTGKTVEQRWIW